MFLRGPTGLSLTDTGRDYLEEVGAALDRLESCTINLMDEAESSRLTLHLFHSLAELWLVPQIGSFLDDHPDIDLEIITQPDEVDLAGSNIDVAIRYTDGPVQGHRCDHLFDETVSLICSPKLLEEHGPIKSAKDVLKHRLISSAYTDGEWNRWFGKHGIEFDDTSSSMIIDSRTSIVRAALEGYGVALCPRPYADGHLASGDLCMPIDTQAANGMAYYLVTPVRTEALNRVKRFRSWLLRISREMQLTTKQ